MAKVIKLTDNSNNTLLPITDASYIQMKVGDDVRSVKDIIIENEEITALALNDLHSSKQEKLISGVTIKTINDESLIGSGDISLPEVYDIRFIATSVHTWTCNRSYSDIVTAFNEGKLIVGMVGQSASNSFNIDGISITLGPLGLNMQDAPDYCFLTAVRNYISGGDHVLFSMIYEDQLGIHGRILLTIRLDSSDNITVHAQAIGEVNAITGGAANQIAYQTAANTTGFIDAPTTDGTVLKYDSRNNKFVWGTDNNTDVNVKITGTSTNSNYPLVFQYNTSASSTTGTTSGLRADSVATTAYFNPGKDTLYTKYSYSTAFTENGITLDNKYAPILKYTIKNASSNAVSFTSTSSSTKMQPNTVYIVGSLSGTSFTWQRLNTLSIGNSSLDGDLGVLWNTGTNSQIPNISTSIGSFSANKTVSTYQILWVAGTNGTSISLPASVKWKDGVAPDSRDMTNKLCELTIMNGLATMNIS